MPFESKAKIAVVTGAGHRLGAAIAEAVVNLGYSLVLHYHSSETKARNLADYFRSTGANVVLVKADLTKESNLGNIWEIVDNLDGDLDLLINSASHMPLQQFGSISTEEFTHTINLNLRAPFLLSQEASKRMVSGGQIINISDIASTLNWTKFPLYSISKVALDGLTRILAKDLAPNIRVNGIAPGLILPPKDFDQKEWASLIEKVPLKRAGLIEEITSAIKFLVENQYITGQTIVIDGGRSIK